MRGQDERKPSQGEKARRSGGEGESQEVGRRGSQAGERKLGGWEVKEWSWGKKPGDQEERKPSRRDRSGVTEKAGRSGGQE